MWFVDNWDTYTYMYYTILLWVQCTDKSTGMAIGSLSTQTGPVKYSVQLLSWMNLFFKCIRRLLLVTGSPACIYYNHINTPGCYYNRNCRTMPTAIYLRQFLPISIFRISTIKFPYSPAVLIWYVINIINEEATIHTNSLMNPKLKD